MYLVVKEVERRNFCGYVSFVIMGQENLVFGGICQIAPK